MVMLTVAADDVLAPASVSRLLRNWPSTATDERAIGPGKLIRALVICRGEFGSPAWVS